jgi:hypothetical protein
MERIQTPFTLSGDLVHPILHATLRHLDGGAVADAHRRAMKEELRDKLFANDGNSYFAVTYGTAVGAAYDPRVPADLAGAEAELDGYVLNPDFPLDPKRNYPTDYVANPLPGYEPSPPTPEEVAVCEQGVEVFGIEVLPGPGIDPDFTVLSRHPLPVGRRVPHDMIWHFSPFNLKRTFGGNAGRDVMVATDLTAPYWIGRTFGVLDAAGLLTALAWRDTGAPCGR